MTSLKNEVEALLFSSGRKMTVEELGKLCRTRNHDKVREAIEELKKDYSDEEKSLMLIQEDGSFKLTVREKYMPVVQKIVTQTELRKSVIETLATIAYKAPVKQSEIVKIRSNKAYDHLNELEEAGFVVREKQGRTKLIKLGEKFFEYFDLPPDKLKEKFMTFSQVEKVIEQKEEEIEKAKEMLEKEKKAVEILGPDGKPQQLDTYGKPAGSEESKGKPALKESFEPILIVDESKEVTDEIEKTPQEKHPGLKPEMEQAQTAETKKEPKNKKPKDIIDEIEGETEETFEEHPEKKEEYAEEGGTEEENKPEESTEGNNGLEEGAGTEEGSEPEEGTEPEEDKLTAGTPRMLEEEEEEPGRQLQEEVESNAEEEPLEVPKSRKKKLAEVSSAMEDALDRTQEPELPESGIETGEESAEEPTEADESEESDEESEEDDMKKKDKSIKEE